MSSSPFSTLPPVDFALKDAALIEAAVISGFESAWQAATGETLLLAEGDPRRLFLLNVCALISQQRSIIDYAGKMTLLAYAQGAFLDQLGAFYGQRGARLAPESASCTMLFTLAGVLGTGVVVPGGTQIQASVGGTQAIFATDQDLIIPAGQTSGQVTATATETGSFANGILPGQITAIVNYSFSFVVSASNTDTTAGASDEEGDEAYRLRLYGLPDTFSTAGPTGAYQYWAFTADPSIIDVAVYGPPLGPAGNVYVIPLCTGGTFPNGAILAAVYNEVSPDTRRPLTDQVFVIEPVAVPYSVDVEYWIDQSNANLAAQIQINVQTAVYQWITNTGLKLGRSINPTTLAVDMYNAGASYVNVISPAHQVLLPFQIGSSSGAPQIVLVSTETDYPIT